MNSFEFVTLTYKNGTNVKVLKFIACWSVDSKHLSIITPIKAKLKYSIAFFLTADSNLNFCYCHLKKEENSIRKSYNEK